jgi:hypothetical protein
MPFSFTQTYSSSAEFLYSTTAISVLPGSTGFATLFSPTVTPPPTILSQALIQVSSLNSFSSVQATTGADAVQWIVNANNTPWYWSPTTGSWVPSNGSYANSTPTSAMNPNFANFFTQTGIQGNANIGLSALLYSSSAVTAPQLTSFTVGYNCALNPASSPATCTIFCYLSDLFGGTVAPSTSLPVTLWVGSDRGFFYGNKFIEPFTKSAQFNSSGYASLTVIETTTPGKELQYWITYYENKSLKTVKFLNAILPNQASISLSQLTTIKTQDFG